MTYNLDYVKHDSIEIDGNGLFVCPMCSKSFRCLAYHTTQVHNIDAKGLRIMFGLPFNYSLQIKEVKEKRRIDALLNKMDVQLIEKGKNTRFKRGISPSKEMIKNISRGHKIKIRKIFGDMQ